MATSTSKRYLIIGNGAAGTYAACGSVYSYGSIQYFNLVTLVVQLVYFSVMWSSFGATLGQRLLGLHVVDAASGGKIGRASCRERV